MTTLAEVVAAALAEDVGPLGDITASLLPSKATAEAFLVPRTDGVLAGCAAAREAFIQVGGTSASWSAWASRPSRGWPRLCPRRSARHCSGASISCCSCSASR